MNRKHFIHRSLAAALGFSCTRFAATAAWQQAGNATVVVNAGIGGNNTRNLLQRLDADCLSHQPTLTIVMIGTNDMNHGKYVPPGEYRQNLQQLAEKIQHSGSRLLLLTILPFYEPYLLTRHPASFFAPEGAAARRNQINQMIQAVAQQQQADYLDTGSLFEKVGKIGEDKDCLLRNTANSGVTDGVHPTPNGYRFLALAISQYILLRQLPAGRIVCFGDSITRGDGSTDKESYPAYLKKLLT